MRILEILILLLLVIPILYSFVPKRRPDWVHFLPITAVLLLPFHWLVEGYRWQMIPAYILAGIMQTISLWRLRQPHGGTHRYGLSLLAGVVGALLLAVAAFLPWALPVPDFPEPSGDFAVGTASYLLTDSSREETYTPQEGDPRELLAQVWYPAADTSGAARAPYVDGYEKIAAFIATDLGLPPFILNHLALVQNQSFVEAAPVEEQFPVLVLIHGLQSGRSFHAFQIHELVSHGYIVVGMDHTHATIGTTFPDGRVIPYIEENVFPNGEPRYVDGKPLVRTWADDVAFLLDEVADWQENGAHLLNGRFNLDQIGVWGHSTGGGATLEFCATDARCDAGIPLDSWVLPVSDAVQASLPAQPMMFINAPNWLGEDNQALGQEIFSRLNGDAFELTIAPSTHRDYTDQPLLSPLTSAIGLSGPLDGEYVLRMQTEYMRAFFDEYVKGETAVLLDEPAAYPELSVNRNR